MMPFRGRSHSGLPNNWHRHSERMINQTVSPRKRLVLPTHSFLCDTLHVCGLSEPFNDDACAHYTDALIREIEMEANSVLHQSAPSTRSISVAVRLPRLSAHDLAESSPRTRKAATGPDCEITIEGRVLNFDAERIDACLDAGANRFSIGIQSFQQQIRKNGRTSGWPNRYCVYGKHGQTRPCRWSVTCCLVCRVRMRANTGGEDLANARYRSRRRRSLCAQCPAQYTAGQNRGKWGVLPCPLRQNVAIFTCKGVILWTMPVGAAW